MRTRCLLVALALTGACAPRGTGNTMSVLPDDVPADGAAPDASPVDVFPGLDVPADAAVDAPEATVDAPSQDGAPDGALDVAVDAPGEASVVDAAPTRCASDRECSALRFVCNRTAGVCVECNGQVDCAMGQMCLGNRCVTPTACTSSRMCPGQVCSASLRVCVDCDADVDCAMGQACVGNACVTRTTCRATADCPMGLQCDAARGACVECLRDAECGMGRLCGADGRCAAQACVPGATSCAATGMLRTCNPRGDGFVETACPSGQRCRGTACATVVACTPGSARCDAMGRREVCDADGMGYTASACPTGETCVGTACTRMTCMPGSTRCAGGALERCNATGTAWETSACPGGTACRNGVCAPTCVPGTIRCVTTSERETCAADGFTWERGPCPSGQFCSVNMCRAFVCAPSSATCISTTTIRLCAADGSGETTVTCPSGSTCTGATGSARCSTWTCAPNAAPTCASATSVTACTSAGTPSTTPCPARSGATVTCAAGVCQNTCLPGFTDCDGNPANGCESLSSAAHCGACGNACPSMGPNSTGECVASACRRACNAGFADCDGSAANGCEADLNGTTHCGRCGVACGAGQSCIGGVCSTMTGVTAPLVTGLGGPAGFGTNCVHPNDDGSWAGPPPTSGFPAVAIPLAPAFPMGLTFGGGTYTTFFVNNNGNITFRAALGTFTPTPFPVAEQPMIAPWWGDVDTRGSGQPMRNNVCFVVEASRIVVTWHLVGYFSSHDDLQNSVQLVLTRPAGAGVASTDFDVEFRYNRCQWTTGDASGGSRGLGGTPAQAGFDFGDRRTAVTLPYSRTMQVLNLCTATNVGMPGVWRFRVRSGAVLSM